VTGITHFAVVYLSRTFPWAS